MFANILFAIYFLGLILQKATTPLLQHIMSFWAEQASGYHTKQLMYV